MKDIVRLENVKKDYLLGKVRVKALKGISLRIEKGEFIAIVGKSGSGKSTLLHIIGCLDKPTSGRVFIKGRDVSKLNDNQLARIRSKIAGFVFQQFNLIPDLTVKENIELPMIFAGIEKDRREKKVEELLNLVELEPRKNFYPNELSGGERQRVAIARALANNPELILADEPTGNLDSEIGNKIISFLERINKKLNKTLVIVTHDKDIAKRAKKIIEIKDGQIKRISK